MKLDGTPEGFRQANAWLHTWSGLVLGWLLFAVFLTGTLSYFLDEINTWMRPELHRSHADAATVQRAVDRLATLAPEAGTWTLNLPDERQPAVEASWRNPGAAAGRAGTSRAWLDAAPASRWTCARPAPAASSTASTSSCTTCRGCGAAGSSASRRW